MANKRVVTCTVNGREESFLCKPQQTLLEVLRDELELTGTKEGCSNGNCGACTVLMNGKPVVSCLVLAVECEGAELETIEGIADHGHLAPVQQAFLDHDVVQCGMCFPGMVMTLTTFLETNPAPTRDEIKTALVGNVCRCTGYERIIDAVMSIRDIREDSAR